LAVGPRNLWRNESSLTIRGMIVTIVIVTFVNRVEELRLLNEFVPTHIGFDAKRAAVLASILMFACVILEV